MPTTIITPDRIAIRRENLTQGGVLDIVTGSHTGDATQTTVATVTLPGGVMGPHGVCMIDFAFSIDAAPANAWTIKAIIGSTEVFTRAVATTKLQHTNNRLVVNVNDETVQRNLSKASGLNDTGDQAGITGATEDTSQDVDVTFDVQLDAADTARTISLDYGMVRVLGLSGE